MKPGFSDVCALSLGNDAENPTCLCAMDVMGDVAWNQGQILNAMRSTGRWRVNVERPGLYRFELRRWPRELPIPMEATVSKEFPKTAIFPNAERVCIHPEKVRFKLFEDEYFASVEPDSERVLFELDLRKTGKTDLDAWFIDADGEERGAYYVYVTRIEE